MKYFTSDTHFDHEKIIELCDRQFPDVEAMNRYLIKEWNRTVRPRDEVYFLGDFTLKGRYPRLNELLSQLNGRISFILGNHDHEKEVRKCSEVDAVYSYREIRYYKRKLCLFHFPIREWNAKFKGSIHLFGHVHGKLDGYDTGKSVDVGVDSREITDEYRPVSIEEILEVLE